MADDISVAAPLPTALDPAYRQLLVAAEQKCQDDFDKTVLSLSGGALAISFVFVKDIVGPNPITSPNLLLLAWFFWACSSLAVLASFYMSHLALRRTIQQCDNGTIRSQKPGGIYSAITSYLNAGGALMFVAGVCFMAAFIYTNLSIREVQHVRQEAAEPATSQSAATPTAATAP